MYSVLLLKKTAKQACELFLLLQLVVRAVDQGSPMQLTGIATLTVEILDQNDNAPVFALVWICSHC